MNTRLTELRMALSQILNQELERGDVSSDQIIAQMRRKHRNVLRAAQGELESIALKRLLNDITARQTKVPNNVEQIEMFSGVDIGPTLFSMRTNEGVVVKKKTGSVKLALLIDSYKNVRKTTADKAKQNFVEVLEKIAKRIGTRDVTLDETQSLLRSAE